MLENVPIKLKLWITSSEKGEANLEVFRKNVRIENSCEGLKRYD